MKIGMDLDQNQKIVRFEQKGRVGHYPSRNFLLVQYLPPRKCLFVQGRVFPVLSYIRETDLTILHALTSIFRCCIPFPLHSFWVRTWAKNFIENSLVAKDGFHVYSESVPSLASENSRCSFLHDENFYFFPILWRKNQLHFCMARKVCCYSCMHCINFL